MDRNRLIAIAVGIALVAFLLGFLPQWSRANGLRDRLTESRQELRMAHVEGRSAPRSPKRCAATTSARAS